MDGVWQPPPVQQRHGVRAPAPPAPDRLRDAFFTDVGRLTRGLYRLTQVRVHRWVTRRFLLGLRGRVPPPGVPAGAAQRLLAAGADLAVCAAAAGLLGCRRRRLAALAGVLAGYHLACWTLAGRTARRPLTRPRL